MAEEKRSFLGIGKKKVQEIVAVESAVENPLPITLSVSEEPSIVEIEESPTIQIQEIPSMESPVEEKIQALVEAKLAIPISGWNNDMKLAPIDGQRVMVSEDAKDRGALVYWRISKFVDKKNLRYIPKGRWTDFLSKIDITFVPKYWKPYIAEEYWPLQSKK